MNGRLKTTPRRVSLLYPRPDGPIYGKASWFDGGFPLDGRPVRENFDVGDEVPHLTDFTDGLSYTVFFIERASLPVWLCHGEAWAWTGTSPVLLDRDSAGAWINADHTDAPDVNLSAIKPQENFGCNTYRSSYSYHSSGSNFAMADGSVRFLVEQIESEAYFALFTRENGDRVE